MKSKELWNRIARSLIRFVIVGAGAYVLICALMYAIQDGFVFYPTTSQYALEVEADEYELDSGDGVALHGYIVNRKADGPVIVFFTGNTGDARSYVNALSQLGATVVLTDYRGYGRNTGKPSEKAILKDAQLIVDWVRSEFPNRPLVLMGFSLGSGVAMLTCDDSVKGLILVSPYRSLVHVAEQTAMRVFPLRLLMRNRFDSRSDLESLPDEVFVLYSTVDTVIPSSETTSLLKHIPQAHVVVDDVSHNSLLHVPINLRTIRIWLETHFGGDPQVEG